MSDSIRVLIVGREARFRKGLKSILDTDPSIEVVGMAASADEGYLIADDEMPDVVLVGTTLTDAPNVAAAAQFRQRFDHFYRIAVTPDWVRLLDLEGRLPGTSRS